MVQLDAGATKKENVSDKKQLFDGALEDDFKDLNSAKRFDQLDFIMIDVPANVLPWQEKSY